MRTIALSRILPHTGRHYRESRNRRDFTQYFKFFSAKLSIPIRIDEMSSVSGAVSNVTDSNGMTSQVLVDAVHITPIQGQDLLLADGTLNISTSPSGIGEPPAKRQKTAEEESLDQNQTLSIKQILFNINKAICLRLDAIENKLETVSLRTKFLEEKVEQMVGHIRQNSSMIGQQTVPGTKTVSTGRRSNAVIVGIPSNKLTTDEDSKEALAGILGGSQRSLLKDASGERSGAIQVLDYRQGPGNLSPDSIDSNIQNLGSNVTLITLNTEEDYPDGCWLGDENNPEMRVRIPITPSDLLHIHSNCRTPEKMALALLDYLFDRETQASSNLSGLGKHGKKQLDPLMIYGIRCHLIHKFGVSETDWHRIKQNIDSKCRTAFRRKMRGLPLTVKAFRGKAPPTYLHVQQSPGGTVHQVHEIGGQSDDSLQQDESELHIQEAEVDMSQAGVMSGATAAELLHGAGGQIQVLHATPEQVAQLQQTHQIQILQGDQVMQFHPGGDGNDGLQVAVSMSQRLSDTIQVVNENGETIHISQGMPEEEVHPNSDDINDTDQ